MKPIYLTILTLILAGVVSYATTKAVQPEISSNGVVVEKAVVKKADESVYDRVMRTGTIRCGYATANPWIFKDANSGRMQGFIVDIMEELGLLLGLEIIWAEDTGWANLAAAINSGRVDVGCSSLWMDPERGKILAFTHPIFFSPVHAYARADDNRFTGIIDEINDPAIKIAVQESNVSLELADRLFSKARHVALSNMISGEEIALNVATRKADILFTEGSLIKKFNASQETQLKRVPFKNPLRVYGVGFPIDAHEIELQNMLNVALLDMITSGKLEDLLANYSVKYPDSYIAIAKPFEVSE